MRYSRTAGVLLDLLHRLIAAGVHQVLQLIAERGNICKQLHLPAQSGSTQVLAAMRRGYDTPASICLFPRICAMNNQIFTFQLHTRGLPGPGAAHKDDDPRWVTFVNHQLLSHGYIGLVRLPFHYTVLRPRFGSSSSTSPL